MTPAELLTEIGAATTGEGQYSATLSFGEHQKYIFEIPENCSDELLGMLFAELSEEVAPKLMQFEYVLGRKGKRFLSIKTTSIVGFSSVLMAGELIFLRVTPKIPTERLLQLAIVAGRLPPWRADTHVGTNDVVSIFEWTVRGFIDAAEALVRGAGIRSSHILSQETLQSRVKGKVIISDFVSNLAKGRPDRIKCEFSKLKLDNRHNRVLKWALHLSKILSQQFCFSDLLPRLNRLDLSFKDVALSKPQAHDLEQSANLPPNMRHYSAALEIARLLIRGAKLDATIGPTPVASVVLDMNDLYEEAFWRLFKRVENRAKRKPPWKLWLKRRGDALPIKALRCEPDVFVPQSDHERAIIIDTKWKDAARSKSTPFDGPGFSSSLIKPQTSDIYQVATYGLAYMRDADLQSCVSVLVYPAIQATPVLEHKIQLGPLDLTIVFVAWNIGDPLDEGIQDFVSCIANYAKIESQFELEDS